MLPKSGNTVATTASLPATGQTSSEVSNEQCPVCQEKILEQKMVFQCGHSMCCKCELPVFAQIYLQVILYVILFKFTSLEEKH
jgi:E3 ubiquitin-protein ligase SHPRH